MATLIIWTIGTPRSRAAASARTSGTPAGPPGPSPASAGPPGPSPASAGPSQPGPEPSPPGAPGQVRLADAGDEQPAPQPAPRRRPSRWQTVIMPITHGLLASATILLALLTALGAT